MWDEAATYPLCPNMTVDRFREGMERELADMEEELVKMKAFFVEAMRTRKINHRIMASDVREHLLEKELYEAMRELDAPASIAAFEAWSRHVQTRLDEHLFGEVVVEQVYDPHQEKPYVHGESNIALKLADDLQARRDANRDNLVCMLAVLVRRRGEVE